MHSLGNFLLAANGRLMVIVCGLAWIALLALRPRINWIEELRARLPKSDSQRITESEDAIKELDQGRTSLAKHVDQIDGGILTRIAGLESRVGVLATLTDIHAGKIPRGFDAARDRIDATDGIVAELKEQLMRLTTDLAILESWRNTSIDPAISQLPQFVLYSSRMAFLAAEVAHILEFGVQLYSADPTIAPYRLLTEYLSNAPHIPRDMYILADSISNHVKRCRAFNIYYNDLFTNDTRTLLGYANAGPIADLTCHQTLLLLRAHKEHLDDRLPDHAARFLPDIIAKATKS